MGVTREFLSGYRYRCGQRSLQQGQVQSPQEQRASNFKSNETKTARQDQILSGTSRVLQRIYTTMFRKLAHGKRVRRNLFLFLTCNYIKPS